MTSLVISWLVSYGYMAAGSTLAVFIVGWILAIIPTGKWSKELGKIGEKNGRAVTAVCQKKIPVWN